jgi:ketosteroid isomerase-like protein
MTGSANHWAGATEPHCPVLTDYFDRLDGRGPASVVELLAPDFRFVALWGEDEAARQSSGGPSELRAYFASRDGTGQRHHVLEAKASSASELAVGYTTRDGSPLASFMIIVQLDDSGRIRRMLAARSAAMSLLD